MFELSVEDHFSGAHHLEGYEGSCSGHHGHNWHVKVVVRGDSLNEMGIVIDYRVLKKMLDEVLQTLDHKDLNEAPEFEGINPSSENIARYIYAQMQSRLNEMPGAVARVTVHETPETSATYWE